MYVLNARNVHQALPMGMSLMRGHAISRGSRNGPVRQFPSPVSTVYEYPQERVLFHRWRDANPFFHFYESLWMLAGQRTVAPLTNYVKKMADFSDDGEIFNAAYGHRWRHATSLDIDQLDYIIAGLRRDPECRRQVLKIWAIKYDLIQVTKDAACNLAATFQVNHNGELDMVVFCRSNDMIWGAYGANAVHFSFLQEYIASAIDRPIGRYTQISVNYHVYEDIFAKMEAARDTDIIAHGGVPVGEYYANPYENMRPINIMNVPREVWDEDLMNFVTPNGTPPYTKKFHDPFFTEVAMPLVRAHDIYKNKADPDRFLKAIVSAECCIAPDWRKACIEWIQRRQARSEES